MFVRSLRFRLTLWYTGALAAVLLLAALLLYTAAQHVLLAQTDSFLVLAANRVAASAADEHEDPPDSSDLMEAVDLRAAKDGYREGKNGKAPQSYGGARDLLLFDVVYARLLDPQNRVVAASPDLVRQPSLMLSLDTIPRAPRAGFAFAGPDEERTMRVLTAPLGHRRSLEVQVAVPWDHNADVLEHLGLVLAVGLPVIVVLAGIGGWVLVGRTLQPIGRIVTEAEKLDPHALPEKLLATPQETDSEVGRLVGTLNRMIMRLRGAFESQKRFAEAQQRFAADASHELRTPLTILRGEMEVALSRPREASFYEETLASAVEEISSMSRIVEGLGFLAHSEAQTLGALPTFGKVNLRKITQDVLSEFSARASEKGLSLRLEQNDLDSFPALCVVGNGPQLQQLLRNIIDNAVKYTSAGQIVVTAAVESAEQPPCCRISVADTGAGIADTDLPHIFERFWRADRVRSMTGSGLGLAICRQIAELHGGALRAESEIGHGSILSFSMPLDLS